MEETHAGLSLPRDVLIAPARAYAEIERTREWHAAYLIVAILGVGGLLLLAPALTNIVEGQLKADPALVPPGANIRQLANEWMLFDATVRVFGPLIGWGFSAIVLALSAQGRSLRDNFFICFSLCANSAVPSALGPIVVGVIAHAHNLAGIQTPSELIRAVPLSLAALRPDASPAELAFLDYWDPFTLWSLILTGLGYATLMKVSALRGLMLSFGLGLAFSLLGAAVP